MQVLKEKLTLDLCIHMLSMFVREKLLADFKTQFRSIIPVYFGDFTTTGYHQSKLF